MQGDKGASQPGRRPDSSASVDKAEGLTSGVKLHWQAMAEETPGLRTQERGGGSNKREQNKTPEDKEMALITW